MPKRQISRKISTTLSVTRVDRNSSYIKIDSPIYSYNEKGHLLFDNYSFSSIIKKGQENFVSWRCVGFNRTKCPVCIKTIGKDYFAIKGAHNHQPKENYKAYVPRLFTQ